MKYSGAIRSSLNLLTRHALPEGRIVEGLAEEAIKRQWDEPMLNRFASDRLATILHSAMETIYYQEFLRQTSSIDDPWLRLGLLPILPRRELRGHFERFLSKNTSRVDVAYTSGTAGQPSAVVKPRRALVHRGSLERRWYRGLDLPKFFRLADVTPWSGFGASTWSSCDWRVSYLQIGVTEILEAFRRGKKVAEFIVAQPDVLMHAAIESSRWPGVIAVASSFEVLSPAVSSQLLHRFAKFGEVYCGAEVCAPMAHAFLGCQGLHVNADYVHLEIVSLQDDHQVLLGLPGRVIVTDLLNDAMPLLRYEIGDIGVLDAADRCNCGRKTPLLRILGRTLPTIMSREGTPVPTSLLASDLAELVRAPFLLKRATDASYELITRKRVSADEATKRLSKRLGPVSMVVRAPDEDLSHLLTDRGSVISCSVRQPIEERLGEPPPSDWRLHPRFRYRTRDRTGP